MARKRFLSNTDVAERIDIAAGNVLDASGVHKFGAVPAMSVNTTGTIWDVNDTLYPWSAFTTAGVLTIPAVDVADNGHTVTVLGLDENYDAVTEIFTVSSSATTTGTKTFKRVFRAFCTNGAGQKNTANINIQRSGTTVARITAGKGQTLMTIYTVPKGYTGYIMKGVMTVAANADATGEMYVKYFGQNIFRVGHSFEVSGTGGPYMYDFTVPAVIPEKSDIDVRATVRSNNARVTSAFDIILVKT